MQKAHHLPMLVYIACDVNPGFATLSCCIAIHHVGAYRFAIYKIVRGDDNPGFAFTWPHQHIEPQLRTDEAPEHVALLLEPA